MTYLRIVARAKWLAGGQSNKRKEHFFFSEFIPRGHQAMEKTERILGRVPSKPTHFFPI